MGTVPDHLPADHFCPWRDEAERLRTRLDEAFALIERLTANVEEMAAKLDAQAAHIESLERRLYGRSSEKLVPVSSELRHERSKDDAEAARLAALDRRRQRAADKQKLRSETVTHHVPHDDRHCPVCGGQTFTPIGQEKRSVVFEYVPGYFVRQEHVRETLACRCGGHIVTAPAPVKPIEKGHYGPGFLAHLVVAKCADSIPLHRLAKQYQRLGIPMSRSTLTDLFHAAARSLLPLADRLAALVAADEIVQADETPMKVQHQPQQGYVWAFLAGDLIAYRFSANRSSETPVRVLGGSAGTLVVDAYTGYNRVTDVDGRARAGCLAHVRRKIFEALSTAPVAREALDLILAVYRVEHVAKAKGLVRTPRHAELRRTDSRGAMEALHAWLVEHQALHPPKSPLGVAISYALNQWPHLGRFLDDVRIPLDNNASERALRVVALGRKNFLFVGHEEAGENLAGLYSLVATCEANDVDPIAYLTDVLIRVHTHPAARIDELLPHLWTRVTGPIAPRADQ
jgi:transposase